VIKLKELIKEGTWYKDVPKRFDEAAKQVDADISEAQARKKKIATLKKDWPKYQKLLDDWGWGRGKAGKMTEEEFDKMMRRYEEQLWDAGVLSPHDRIES